MSKNLQWNFEPGEHGLLSSGRLLWLRAIVWAAVLFAVTLALFFASFSLDRWFHLPPHSGYVTALFVPVLGFIVYAVAVRKGERRIAQEVMLATSTAWELLIGAAIGFTMIVATLALLWALGLYRVEMAHWTNWLNSFLFDSYISGLLEELAFRAILLRIFARVFNPMTGLVLSSILFGIAHLSHGTWLAAAEVAFNGGLVMGLLYMATGRLWMSVGMHIAWDFTEESILGVNSHGGLLLSTPAMGRPDILTGGTYGPDGSALAGIVGVVFIAGILYANSKGMFSQLTSKSVGEQR